MPKTSVVPDVCSAQVDVSSAKLVANVTKPQRRQMGHLIRTFRNGNPRRFNWNNAPPLRWISPAVRFQDDKLAEANKCIYSKTMSTFIKLIVSAILAVFTSLIVAGLFLPIYGIFEGGTHNCLSDGIGECVSFIPMSALIYGPLFSIAGIFIGTPVFMMVLGRRD